MHPPRFDCLAWYRQPFAEGAPEQDWLEAALAGSGGAGSGMASGATAAVWHCPPCLVAPAGYRARLAAQPDAGVGFPWPVRQRRSGGGLVPQGPGIVNLSLAWQPGGAVGDCGEGVYRFLCGLLAQACSDLGVETLVTAVPGSFCDGRFNLACGDESAPRKLAGTAQHWRHRHGHHAVLAHALVLLDTDPVLITAQVNALEERLGTGRRHDAAALCTLAGERAARGLPALPELAGAFAGALAAALGTPLLPDLGGGPAKDDSSPGQAG